MWELSNQVYFQSNAKEFALSLIPIAKDIIFTFSKIT
jgi:hypothetical protein